MTEWQSVVVWLSLGVLVISQQVMLCLLSERIGRLEATLKDLLVAIQGAFDDGEAEEERTN